MTLHHIIWIDKNCNVHQIADSNFTNAYNKALKGEGFKRTHLLREWNTLTGRTLLYVDMEVDK